MQPPRRPTRAPTGEIGRLIQAVRSEGEPDQYAGKRHFTRFSDVVILEMSTDPSKPHKICTVYMHNISDGGFAFWCRAKIPARSYVFVREPAEHGQRPWIKALVTHCTLGIRGFLIGAAFEAAAPAA